MTALHSPGRGTESNSTQPTQMGSQSRLTFLLPVRSVVTNPSTNTICRLPTFLSRSTQTFEATLEGGGNTTTTWTDGRKGHDFEVACSFTFGVGGTLHYTGSCVVPNTGVVGNWKVCACIVFAIQVVTSLTN